MKRDQKRDELRAELERLSAHVMALECILRAFLELAAIADKINPQIIRSAFNRAQLEIRLAGEQMPARADIHITRIQEMIEWIRAAIALPDPSESPAGERNGA